MKKSILIVLVLLMNVSVKSQEITIGKRDSIYSNVLKENRPFSVYFPPSYFMNPLQKYPVLYILDGDYNFMYVSGIIELQSSISENIPEMIVVAISGKGSQEYRKNCRPFAEGLKTSGNAEEIIKFIETELVPFINQKYKSNDYKILGGHSIGGLFVIHTALQKPNLFNHYIAISPALWWENNHINSIAKEVLAKNKKYTSSVYVSLANEKGMGVHSFLGEVTNSMLANASVVYGIGFLFLLMSIFLYRKMKDSSLIRKIATSFTVLLLGVGCCLYLLFEYYPTNDNFRFQKFANENHNSVGTPTYNWALQDIFKDWRVSKMYFDTTDEMVSLYETSKKKYGKIFPIPNGTFANTVVYILKDNEDELQKMKTKVAVLYPNSVPYFNTLLADNLLAKKKIDAAEKLLKETLSSYPTSFEVIAKLATVKKEQKLFKESDSLFATSIIFAKEQHVRQWQINELIEAKETVK